MAFLQNKLDMLAVSSSYIIMTFDIVGPFLRDLFAAF